MEREFKTHLCHHEGESIDTNKVEDRNERDADETKRQEGDARQKNDEFDMSEKRRGGRRT